MFAFLRIRKPKIDAKTLNYIKQGGYKVEPDGSVACTTCGSYCGQCGDDRSAPDVTSFRAHANQPV